MSITDFLFSGQDVIFEIDREGKRHACHCKVESINHPLCTVKILDDRFDKTLIAKRMEAQIVGYQRGLKFSLPVKIKSVEKYPVICAEHIPSRTHLRVDGHILFQYVKITKDEFAKKRERYLENIDTESSDVLPFSLCFLKSGDDILSGNIPPEIVCELRVIQKKLDLILRLLRNSDDDKIFKEKPTKVNISGAGIRFKSIDAFHKGDLLEMKMILPNAPSIVLEAIGEVVRISSLPGKQVPDAERVREIAVKFAAISEDTREAVIKYVFKRQREILRAKEGGKRKHMFYSQNPA